MWRFFQGIPKGFRGNFNGSVRQTAPPTVCRDDESDGEVLHKLTATTNDRGAPVSCKGSVDSGRVRKVHNHNEWHDWKKTHFRQHFWQQHCQHCRFLEAVGWSSALLLGCKLSQLWKYKQARDERRNIWESGSWRSRYEAAIKEPSLLANYVSDTKRKELENDATWSKTVPAGTEGKEPSEEDDQPDTGIKKTPVAWAASEFPSLWGKPLLVQSKLLAELDGKLQIDGKSEEDSDSAETKDQQEDCTGEEDDLGKLCQSIKYNREGNRFARNGDFEKAILCWKKAALNGSAKAHFNLGLCYEIGTGVPADRQKAIEYYEKAAARGSAVAAHNLALIYLNGDDKSLVKKAEALLRQASEQGFVDAQIDLGVMLTETGDMAIAAQLFQLASLQKDSTAEYYLGLCYENGWGVARNLCKSAALYSSASKRGQSAAQYNLANFFENGLGGLPVDKAAALDLYRRSAKGGHLAAAKHAVRLDTELNKTTESLDDGVEVDSIKISSSVPTLTSYLTDPLSQLGKLEWEWTRIQEDPHLSKSATLGDFREVSTEEDSRENLLLSEDSTSDSENRPNFFDREDSFDSVVKFDLGEMASLSDSEENSGESSLSWSGQFGDAIYRPKTSELKRSPSFDRLSCLSDSDASELSIVFDDNFEGFRLIPNKAQEKELGVKRDSISDLTMSQSNSFGEYDAFDNAWSLTEMNGDFQSSGRHLVAFN